MDTAVLSWGEGNIGGSQLGTHPVRGRANPVGGVGYAASLAGLGRVASEARRVDLVSTHLCLDFITQS